MLYWLSIQMKAQGFYFRQHVAGDTLFKIFNLLLLTTNVVYFLIFFYTCEDHIVNNMDPDQTAPLAHIVCFCVKVL